VATMPLTQYVLRIAPLRKKTGVQYLWPPPCWKRLCIKC